MDRIWENFQHLFQGFDNLAFLNDRETYLSNTENIVLDAVGRFPFPYSWMLQISIADSPGRGFPLQDIPDYRLRSQMQAVPVASPDEIVIQQRDRRRLPATWTSDIDLNINSFQSAVRSPPQLAQDHLSPHKSTSIPLKPQQIDVSDNDKRTPEKLQVIKSIKSKGRKSNIKRLKRRLAE